MHTSDENHMSPRGELLKNRTRRSRKTRRHTFRLRRRALVLFVCLIMSGSSMAAASVKSWADSCDMVPNGVETKDYWLHFKLPAGLMPDKQFDGRPAKLQVHRVRPVYANKCPTVPNRAAVLIHGRTVSGAPTFDLQHPAPGGGKLSVQEALARAGMDTFVPNLLGYSPTTTFDEGLNDPGNASLRPYETDGSCRYAEGCDRTSIPFSLDQQGSLLLTNPLGGQRRAHSSNVRFVRMDVWVRDIRQVIDDAIAQAQPADGKVTLIGYSFGGARVGRALDTAKYPEIVAKVNRAVIMSSIFGLPTEETTPPGGFATFPLSLTDRATVVDAAGMSSEREAVCAGYRVDGMREQLWAHMIGQENVGRDWGGTDPNNPAGLVRTPTFSSYGWNSTVAGQLTPPTLVMQGLDDTEPRAGGTAPAIYNALPASMTNKVLVQIDCATHGMMWEGCSNATRCTPTSGTPYGGEPGKPWYGPHSTVKAALIEWITNGTFNGAQTGKFIVNSSGVANASGP
jgi:pimeloyl-ACP methyl ester carboxylesterase